MKNASSEAQSAVQWPPSLLPVGTVSGEIKLGTVVVHQISKRTANSQGVLRNCLHMACSLYIWVLVHRPPLVHCPQSPLESGAAGNKLLILVEPCSECLELIALHGRQLYLTPAAYADHNSIRFRTCQPDKPGQPCC